MTTHATTCWQPLGTAPAQPDCDNTDLPCWYWLPGWGFKADIFAHLCQHIPGRHFGLSYSALLPALAEPSFKVASEYLIQHSNPNAHWVGWSLGGALAAAVCETQSHARLTTLATGKRFCRYGEANHGMPAETLAVFIQGFERQPAKTLKRFTALCSQGSHNPRELGRTLAAHQYTPDQDMAAEQLLTTLNWLTEFDVTVRPNTGLALYGDQDALTPGGLQPQQTLSGSHAFWLEPDNQSQILALLQRNPS